LPEAKALTRLVNIGISAIEADNEPVGNPVTLQRTVEACKSGLHKIESAILNVEPGASGKQS
jgi:hypothetical protein